jgi:hypothetical protein
MERMTKAMRDLLVAHIDGPIEVELTRIGKYNYLAYGAAMRAKLLVSDTPGPHNRRPKITRLSDKGRQALAAELGEMVEVLLRAQAMVTDITARALLHLPNETREVAEAKTCEPVP